MDRNSNSYTFLFAIIMVVVIASILAFLATALKPMQDANVRNEKMQNILSTIGVKVDRDHAEADYKKYIKEYSLKKDGSIDKEVKAFNIDLKKEIKKDPEVQRYPIYIAEKDGKKYYIVPLFGKGLWDDIWGYIALQGDRNTIVGAVFDHKGETPGLGAEIATDVFQNQFIGKQILKEPNGDYTTNNFVSVKTVKGGAPMGDKHGVDGISGGTITSDKLSEMVAERLEHYLPYFKQY
ncbi:NADH:ubiquinone reductase (Na(+)-transporting) subunit C [Aureivirga sp. CE67]|uniref:NADH:ubiquinone reductase (Na(+)-transporting) subunit C n=1 Tax=Aureivirga sp. CE67 TaxID=1788983 RepID=UPI0018CAC517|nr:NADH:ubiquinone reductase (Na(+)-transporting) subunit C [Aureivirga sp. CE67]